VSRTIDLVVSVAGLLILAPVLAIVGLAVWLESTGPVIFRQQRVGLEGKRFEIFKFRTMVVVGDARGPIITSATDPRITRIGRLLRSTKLDELPQLVNVLRGDMGLVGPRPEVPRYIALWSAEERDTILSMRPGISNPATVQFRRESELLAIVDDPERYYREQILPMKVKTYVAYVENRTLRGDLRILGETVRETLFR